MIKNNHLKLSVLTLALTVSSAAIADINLGTDINDITVNVNSDDGDIGDFIVLNGTNFQIENFRSNRHFTSITTSDGNKFTLDNNGAHLSDITLSGVADGVSDSDAVNVSQLNSETAARTAADVVLQNNINIETAERIAGDRATLASANAYTDQSFAKIEKRYQAAVAASIAIASLPQPTEAGKRMISFGTGAWESEQGYAMGVSGVTANNKWVYKAAASADNRGKFGGGLSVGLQW